MSKILIVGAGPVGLTMAAELARYALPTRIIDKAPHATETSKALVVWSRTLELLERAESSQGFLQAGLHARSAAIHNGGAVLGRTGLADVLSPYNFALMIPQRDTERLLAAHLGTFNVAVERQVELMAFTQTRDGIEAHLRHADGAEECVHTPWLIGCDGAHSIVRHTLGADFHGDTRNDDWLLADVRLEGAGAPPGDEISIYLHHDGPLVVFPMPAGRARIIAAVGKSDPAHPRGDPTLAEVQGLADERAGVGFKLTDPVWLANFRINERKVSDYRRNRIFLAGDAAHVHSPAGGQGMNTGMQDAFNLAWKLAMVQNGDAGPSLLDSYSPERSAVGDMVLRNAGRLTDMATLAHPAAQAARNVAAHFLLGMHAIRERLATTMSEINIAYADSPLSVGRHAGDRFPPRQYAGLPPGSGTTPRFTLYAGDTRQGDELAKRFPTLLQAQCRPAPDAERLLIVRPDAYVGFAASAGRWQEAESYLSKLLPT